MAISRRGRKPKKPLALVVENEPTILVLSASNIEEAGYATLSAASAREALALIEGGAKIDLLFTDIRLPDGTADPLDGIELASRAVEFLPGLRVVYTSGGGVTDGMRALFVEGATFLLKPYTREQLIEALRDR